jgi:hypothetical protein
MRLMPSFLTICRMIYGLIFSMIDYLTTKPKHNA